MMPAAAKRSKPVESGESEYEILEKWMKDSHKGYSSKLVSRDIPGAGRGLFAAEKNSAGETILEIPSSALLNPLTLASDTTIPEYLHPVASRSSSESHVQKKAKTTRRSSTSTSTSPQANRLNTTQFLTLYLALHRDPASRQKTPWTAYFDTLPKSFSPWHPLTWCYEPEDSWLRRLVEMMPSSTRAKLEDVKGRYEEDAGVLRGILIDREPFKSDKLYPKIVTEDTLLWAWLNVNTRTVSVPLDLPGPSSLNNHTFVPILDMLNHSSKPEEIIPKPIQIASSPSAPKPGPGTSRRGAGARAQPHLIPGKIGFRLIAPERGLEKDEQVRFEYGAHSTETLFTEYGFTPERLEGKWLDQPNGEVDVNDLVDKMFPIKSEKIKMALEEIGCWKRNMIYAFPRPVSVSHGLIMTLRLFTLNKIETKKNAEILEDVRRGLETHVEAEGVERDTRRALFDICQTVWDECNKSIEEIYMGWAKRAVVIGPQYDKEAESEETKQIHADEDAATKTVAAIWEERKVIAGQLKTGIAAGQRIWD